jgi:hypothetical protein
MSSSDVQQKNNCRSSLINNRILDGHFEIWRRHMGCLGESQQSFIVRRLSGIRNGDFELGRYDCCKGSCRERFAVRPFDEVGSDLDEFFPVHVPGLGSVLFENDLAQ